MGKNAANSRSVWMDAQGFKSFSGLNENLKADVCVIGAGVAGLSCAYSLSREGKSVVLLDDGPVGAGETGRTTAHVTNIVDEGYAEIERLHGAEGAKMVAQSHTRAVEAIAEIVHRHKIDCDWERVDAYLFKQEGSSEDAEKRFLKEMKACLRAGIGDVTLMDHAPLEFPTGSVLRFGGQAQFHPLKYLNRLITEFQISGGKIFTDTHVAKVEDGKDPVVITSTGHTIRADAVIVATNTPFNDCVRIHTKQSAYRTYAIGVSIPRRSVTKALYWDDPTEKSPQAYHYVRVWSGPDSDVLIVGGEDHKVGQANDAGDRYRRLETWTRQRFPKIRSVVFRWSGQVMEPIDGLAFIGKNPGGHNVYVATGDCGQGMTYGTIASLLLTDLICGRKNDWEKLYDPARKTLQATPRYLRENTNVVAQYADWFRKGKEVSVEDILPGCGTVISDGMFTKTAVFRDGNNTYHARSAICPHLGGIVRWNDSEKSWDCPCHGSRFDPFGKVLNGPAACDLRPAVLPEKHKQHTRRHV